MASQLSLFRQEAIDFQQHHRQWGHVALLQPLSTRIITWFIAAAVSFIVAFLFLGEFARKETVAGYLTPTAGTAKIFASKSGTIKEVYVKEGEEIETGQPLLAIETSQIAADGEDINASMLATLKTQRGQLTSQIAAEQERMKSEQARLSSLIAGLNAEISELRAQIEIQNERIKVSNELVSSVTELRAKGLVSDPNYRQRQLNALDQKQKLNSLKQQVAARQNQLTETQYSLEQLPIVTSGKVQSLHNELSTTEQHIDEVRGRRAYVIRSPTAGRIAMMQANVGKFADPQRPQMEIIPSESKLQAELFVPTRAIGFVRPGQRVRILYDAFPYQQFGTYGGRVKNVSQTVLTKSDASGPVDLKEPAYAVTVALDQPDVNAYGKHVPLQADMVLRADIILEKRPLMKWLLDPLLSVRM